MMDQSFTLIDERGTRFEICELIIDPPALVDGMLMQRCRASLPLQSPIQLGHASITNDQTGETVCRLLIQTVSTQFEPEAFVIVTGGWRVKAAAGEPGSLPS